MSLCLNEQPEYGEGNGHAQGPLCSVWDGASHSQVSIQELPYVRTHHVFVPAALQNGSKNIWVNIFLPNMSLFRVNKIVFKNSRLDLKKNPNN